MVELAKKNNKNWRRKWSGQNRTGRTACYAYALHLCTPPSLPLSVPPSLPPSLDHRETEITKETIQKIHSSAGANVVLMSGDDR